MATHDVLGDGVPEEVVRKYQVEREKRLRSDGIRQYRSAKGQLAKFVEDPNVAPGFTREPEARAADRRALQAL